MDKIEKAEKVSYYLLPTVMMLTYIAGNGWEEVGLGVGIVIWLFNLAMRKSK